MTRISCITVVVHKKFHQSASQEVATKENEGLFMRKMMRDSLFLLDVGR
jgi:hypothetical protein